MITIRQATTSILILLITSVSVQVSAQLGNRSVPSPDRKHAAAVDRLHTAPGAESGLSGKMVVRILPADGTTIKQKYIETSQVRVVQPPLWLNNTLCAFSYNIAKNAHGMVFYDVKADEAIQVEFIATSRPMGADREIVQELNSLEVVLHREDVEPIRIENITRDNRSVFPLAIGAIPDFQNRPFTAQFYDRLRDSINAYNEFSRKAGVETLVPESASESFNQSGTTMAALLCAGEKSYLVTVPIRDAAPAEILKAAGLVALPGISLSCSHHAAGSPGDEDQMDYGSRHVTHWISDKRVAVDKESFDTEDETSIRTTLFELSETGKLEKKNTVTTAPLAADMPIE